MKGPHVPGQMAGAIPVTAVNNSPDLVCLVSMFPAGAAGDQLAASGVRPENWLGDDSKREKIAPGASRTFSIQPGSYRVVMTGCQAPTYLGVVEVPIQDATTINFGEPKGAPASGKAVTMEAYYAKTADDFQAYVAAHAPKSSQQAAAGGGSCIADGQRSAGTGGDGCCSPTYHPMFLCNSTQTVDFCGPKRDGEGSTLPCN